MTTVNYKALIKSAKQAARDVLRTEKVNALLGYISNVEAKITQSNERVERAAKQLAREEYDLRIATEFEHPDLADITKNVEESRKRFAEYKSNEEKEVTALNEKIAEYNTKIENWHNGTSKVDLDRLNTMAEAMVREKVGVDFNMGLYTADANSESVS
jgi:hypothetical protein